MLVFPITQAVELLYYLRFGSFGDIVIFAVLSAWKLGYHRLKLLVVAHRWTIALTTLLSGICFLVVCPVRCHISRKATSPTCTGFGRPPTYSRIVKDAAILFLGRKLHASYRSEPLKQSIGRHATKVECSLEPIFRNYLRFLVEQSLSSLSVRYVPDGVPDATGEQMLSAAAEGKPDTAEQLEFQGVESCILLKIRLLCP
jgi:hypothetical protein